MELKKFIIKAIIFGSLILVSMGYVFFQANGYSDPFYMRFATPKQTSLILGTSKAGQGLQPTVFNEILEKPFFNYSFTHAHSLYGPSYLKSIQRKLDTTQGKNGIFIMTIDPWSISSDGKDPNNVSQFDESVSFLEDLDNVSSFPNIGYLFNYFKGNNFKMLKKSGPIFLHEDGWLEVSINMNENKVAERIEDAIRRFDKRSKLYTYSETRWQYTLKTIQYLQNYGKVYLVRLPEKQELVDIGNRLVPDFNAKIEVLSQQTGAPFLDLTHLQENYQYTDGVHLYKDSGKIVSQEIAEWIKHYNVNGPK